MCSSELMIAGYPQRQVKLKASAFRELGSDLRASVRSLRDQEFASVRCLGDELRIGSATDQRKRLRGPRHHRTAMAVAIGAQRPVGRRGTEPEPQIGERLVFDGEPYRAPLR